jgi:hypothetical protein
MPPREEMEIWKKYAVGPGLSPLSGSEAQQHLTYFTVLHGKWSIPFVQAWQATCFNLAVGMGPVAPGTVTGPAALLSALYVPTPGLFYRATERGPPPLPLLALRASPVLAVRAAHRAVAQNPYDSQGYLILAESTLTLLNQQENIWAQGPQRADSALRMNLREMQVIAALKSYLTLQPDDANVHLEMWKIFRGLHYLDAAHEHLQAAAQHLRRTPGETAANFQERQRQIAQVIQEEEKELKKRRDHFDLRSARQGQLQKFELALNIAYRTIDANNKERTDWQGLGLALKALSILQESLQDARFKHLTDSEKRQVILWQAHVLLKLGRIHEVEAMREELPKILGAGSLHLEAGLAAATGNYKELDQVLLRIEKEIGGKDFNPVTLTYLMAPRSADAPVFSQVGATLGLMPILTRHADSIRERVAELRTLRGIMALEQGNTDQAARFFREALRMAEPNMQFTDRPVAERYLDLMGKR